MANCFPSQNRLLKNSEFLAVFQQSRVLRGKWVNVHYQKTAQSLPKLGLVVSKKSLKRAVERNCFKRITRELFRQMHLPCWNFVVRFVPKNARLKALQKAELKLEIQRFFEQLQ